MSILPVRPTLMRSLAAGAVIVAAAACSTGPERPTASLDVAASAAKATSAAAAHNHAGPTVAVTPGHYRVAEQVKAKLAAFEDIAAARAAGYSVQYPAGCAATDAGAQGFHYLNESLVDNHVEVMRPELVMYEPQADGSMELVGVDYVIPFDQWKSPEAPKLLGVPMNRNEPLGVWALHIWAQRSNPSGLFAPWNPTVSCQHAGAVTP